MEGPAFQSSYLWDRWLICVQKFISYYDSGWNKAIGFINHNWDEMNPSSPLPECDTADQLFKYINRSLDTIVAFCNFVLLYKQLLPQSIKVDDMVAFTYYDEWTQNKKSRDHKNKHKHKKKKKHVKFVEAQARKRCDDSSSDLAREYCDDSSSDDFVWGSEFHTFDGSASSCQLM